MIKKKINKKYSIFVMMFVLMISSISATQIYTSNNGAFDTIPNTFTNQIYKHKQSILGNETLNIDILRNIIFETPYKTLVTIQTLNNDNITHSYKLYANGINGEVTFNNVDFSLSPNQQNLYGIMSSIENEEVDIFMTCIDCNNTYAHFDVTYTLIEEQPKTINTIFTPLINGVIELININIEIWKILYYLFVTVVVFGFIGFLFFIAFTLFKFGNEMKKGKHRIIEVFDRKEDNKKEDK